MVNSMYNHNGNDITKKPVHVIHVMVLIDYVDIGDSSANTHLCSLSRAFIVIHTNIAREKSVFPCSLFITVIIKIIKIHCNNDGSLKYLFKRLTPPVQWNIVTMEYCKT